MWNTNDDHWPPAFINTRWRQPSPSRHRHSTRSPITVDIFSSWARNRNNNNLGAFLGETETEDSCAHVTRTRTKTEKEITHKMSYEQTACDGNHNVINFQVLQQPQTILTRITIILTIATYFIMFTTRIQLFHDNFWYFTDSIVPSIHS